MTYEKATQIARDLIDPNALDRTSGATEYARGICELLADMFPGPGVYITDRARQIAKDIGITDRDLYDYDLTGEEEQ